MSAVRLRSDFWVSAYIRRCQGEGAVATLARRGAAEAGAIFVRLDTLDGAVRLFGPAPQALMDGEDYGERQFTEIPLPEPTAAAAWERLQKEIRFDPDLWIVDVEDRAGRCFLPLRQ
ncbi:DUF1491 family protein [Camelimonas abortus]|uniref:DUF1491 family protein n=1 Tax=Camelimonas abortus TaxID=1017184 RepID=A0ABV7LI35_9HYPH